MDELIGKRFVTKTGVPYPVYEITHTDRNREHIVVFCHWENGNVSGFGDPYELHELFINDALEFPEINIT